MEKDSETIQEMERCSTSYKKRKKFYLIIIFVLLTFLTIPFFYVIKDFIQWGGFTGKNENLYKLIICLFITILIFLYLLIRNKRDSKSSNVYLGKGIVVLLVILNFGVIIFPSHYLNERFSNFSDFTSRENIIDTKNVSSQNSGEEDNNENTIAMSDSTAVDSNGNEIHSNGNEISKVTEKKETQSEEISKQAYRKGYYDGKSWYKNGDASVTVVWTDFLPRHPEIYGADVYVYKSGFDDGVNGYSPEY